MTPFHNHFNSDTTWFVADLHLNHTNLCKGTSKWADKSKTRDFQTLADMYQNVIESVNRVVDRNDTLFINGDILFGDKEQIYNVRNDINCETIHYIYGNHCDWLRKNKNYQKLFTSCSDYLEIFVGKKMLCLFHYPMKVWRDSHRGSYAITGHSHGSLPYAEHELGLDVGWDVFGAPISFGTIHSILKAKIWKPVDHHNQSTN